MILQLYYHSIRVPDSPPPDMALLQYPPSSKASLERGDDGHARFHGCTTIRDFEILSKLGEGTFGYALLSALMVRRGLICGAGRSIKLRLRRTVQSLHSRRS
jgi:hypothetical protein